MSKAGADLAELKTLPRGPHAISPEIVLAHQRERILAATAKTIAEQGYAGLSVSAITARARISRRTFYELYDDKLDCALATHLAAFERLEVKLRTACAGQRDWPAGVSAALAAALELAAAAPAEAQLLAFAPVGAGPKMTAQALAANKQLLKLLRAGREDCPIAESPGDVAEQALLMGLAQLIGAELLAGRAAALTRLGPELGQVLLTPFLGEAEARRATASA